MEEITREVTRQEMAFAERRASFGSFVERRPRVAGGDAAVNDFFQKLYKDADEDTRRAMLKSYQESGGTTLSTNWSEVGKGRVEVKPPEGSEWKKWAA